MLEDLLWSELHPLGEEVWKDMHYFHSLHGWYIQFDFSIVFIFLHINSLL